jgi:hypothetical protein
MRDEVRYKSIGNHLLIFICNFQSGILRDGLHLPRIVQANRRIAL